MQGKNLSAEQILLITLVVKLAVMAALATMLVRYRRFRHILIFERRAWPDRLIFALSLGIPLSAGVVSRLLLHYDAADLTLEGSFLAGLIAGPYAGAIVGLMVGAPPLANGEWGALPFAVGCGFAGGGLRELCPKEAIWHFSPFVLTNTRWGLVRAMAMSWTSRSLSPWTTFVQVSPPSRLRKTPSISTPAHTMRRSSGSTSTRVTNGFPMEHSVATATSRRSQRHPPSRDR